MVGGIFSDMGKKKTGIMGGTFNPIHIGHLLLAENAKEAFGLDEILFVPSGLPYMKNGIEIADKWMRLEMTRLAVSDNPAFVLSSAEVEREGNSYTWETLELLRDKEPETEFFFIEGADSLFAMESWKNPEIIFRDCTILAAVRDGKDDDDLREQIARLEKKYGARIGLIGMKEISFSSTDIRERIRNGRSIRYMVPDKVIEYIKKYRLYME